MRGKGKIECKKNLKFPKGACIPLNTQLSTLNLPLISNKIFPEADIEY
jgi:hypothetical protein